MRIMLYDATGELLRAIDTRDSVFAEPVEIPKRHHAIVSYPPSEYNALGMIQMFGDTSIVGQCDCGAPVTAAGWCPAGHGPEGE